MKLIYSAYNLELDIQENNVTILSIENTHAYATILQDIWNQTQGSEGGFVFCDGEKEKNISKELVCIFNPFELDFNEKKILTKLYQELQGQANDCFFNEGLELNSKILVYLENILNKVPYSLEYNVDFDVNFLLKMYGVRVQCYGESLLEKIIEYVRIMSQICNVRTMVFVGLKQYLDIMELRQLYEFVFYEKINLVIIEAIHSVGISGEKCWILDKDLCIIDL